MQTYRVVRRVVFTLVVSIIACIAGAQSAGNSGSINGTVLDSTGAVVPNAKVEIRNPVSGFDRSTVSDSSGSFQFTNIPFNPYHLSVSAVGFNSSARDVEPRSAVPMNVQVTLQVAESTTQVTVEGGSDLVENDPTFHTDVDKGLFDKLPLESSTSAVSSLVTLSTPGISADSNGLFHGLGDHAENSFVVDNQPITDQQSKVFSNQIPLDSIESLEVVSGAPPAEYGDKTSVVINVTTRSGQGVTTPHGSFTASYGSFGTSTGAFDLSYGGQKWGNFISARGFNRGRFFHPPPILWFAPHGTEKKCVGPRGLPDHFRGFNPFELRLYALLVPDAEYLRFPERDALEWCRGGQWRLGPQRQRRGAGGPRLPNQNLQHRAILDAAAQLYRRVYPGRLCSP